MATVSKLTCNAHDVDGYFDEGQAPRRELDRCKKSTLLDQTRSSQGQRRQEEIDYNVRKSVQPIAKATSSYNTDNDDDHLAVFYGCLRVTDDRCSLAARVSVSLASSFPPLTAVGSLPLSDVAGGAVAGG